MHEFLVDRLLQRKEQLPREGSLVELNRRVDYAIATYPGNIRAAQKYLGFKGYAVDPGFSPHPEASRVHLWQRILPFYQRWHYNHNSRK